MTGREFGEMIDKLGLSRAGAARFLEVNDTTVRRWAKSVNPVPRPVAIALVLMERYELTQNGVEIIMATRKKK